MRKYTVRRKVARRAKTRRGGMNNPPPPYNDLPPYVANHPPSYTNSSSNMGTQSNSASSSNMGTQSNRATSSNMATQSNRASRSNMGTQTNRKNASTANPAPNQNAPIVQAYHNNRHNANLLPIPAGPVFDIQFDMQNEMERFKNIGGRQFSGLVGGVSGALIKSTRDFITSLGDEQVLTINYMWLFSHPPPGPVSNWKAVSPGYLYIITREHVYMTLLNYVYPSFAPFVFKIIYKFAEPLSAQLCDIFISYCKKDINLLSIGPEFGVVEKKDNKDDLELHRGKLEAIINAIPSI